MPSMVLVAALLGTVASGPVAAPTPIPADVVDIRGIVRGSGLDQQKAAARGIDAREVEVPRVVRSVTPVFPDEVRHSSVPLRIVVECIVGTDGKTSDCKLAKASNTAADRATVEAVRKWSLSPLKLRGKPRRALMSFAFAFDPAPR